MMDWYFLAAVNLALIAVVYQISIGRPRWIDIRGSWVLLAYQLPILYLAAGFNHCFSFLPYHLAGTSPIDCHFILVKYIYKQRFLLCHVLWVPDCIWDDDADTMTNKCNVVTPIINHPRNCNAWVVCTSQTIGLFLGLSHYFCWGMMIPDHNHLFARGLKLATTRCMLHCPQFGKSMSLDFHYLFILSTGEICWVAQIFYFFHS